MRTPVLERLIGASLLLAGACVSLPGTAQDTITVRRMSLELARDIAFAAIKACRETGYQVSAVVVDREGNDQIAMRDTLAPHFTLQIAREKANAVILSGVSSGDFRDSREDIRMEMNHVDGVIVLEGGLPITAAGSTIGAVGVSGAPGGDLDAECAAMGIAAVEERLLFIE
jgi:uncharacterized protein GlcG (DUF336 family)